MKNWITKLTLATVMLWFPFSLQADLLNDYRNSSPSRMLDTAKEYNPEETSYFATEGKDLNKAVQWYEKAANAGSVEAANWLGRFYFEKKNYPKAMYWLEEKRGKYYASWWGYHDRYIIAEMYRRGLGVPQDYARAIEIYEEDNDPRAIFVEAEQRGRKVDLKTLEAEAKAGNVEAAELLAIWHDCYGRDNGYSHGEDGGCVPNPTRRGGGNKNYREAFGSYVRLNELTQKDGKYDPKILYALAKNVPSSQATSFGYFKLAANEGHPWALYYTAHYLAYGFGTIKNEEEALKYAKLACNAGVDRGCRLANKIIAGTLYSP